MGHNPKTIYALGIHIISRISNLKYYLFGFLINLSVTLKWSKIFKVSYNAMMLVFALIISWCIYK